MRDLLAALLLIALFLTEVFFGSLLILSFQNMVKADWISRIEPFLRSHLRVFYILPPLYLVLFIFRDEIYPWVHLEKMHPGFQQLYFNPWFFAGRSVLFLALWGGLAIRARQQKMKAAALPMILILFTGSVFIVDWFLSLQPDWKSSAYPLTILISSLLLAHAWSLSQISKTQTTATPLRDLNNIHLALVAVWSYVSFCQFLIIWSSNLPDEVAWLLPRTHTSWHWLPQLLMVMQFAVPLVLLFFRALKKSEIFTRALGLVTFSAQIIFIFWNLAPAFHPQGFYFSLYDGVAVLLFFLLWILSQRQVPL